MSVIPANPDVLVEAKIAGDRAAGESALTATLPNAIPSTDFLRLIPHDYARRHLILSAGTLDHCEHLLVSDRTRPGPIHNVGTRLGRGTETIAHPADALAAMIDRRYAEFEMRQNASAQRESARAQSDDGHSLGPVNAPEIVVDASTDVEEDLRALLASADADLLSTSGKAPLVKLVDLLLFEAVQRQASDIHVQPLADRTLVRYRLDGVLHTVRELPPRVLPPIVSRVKVMARLDVAERGAPQDGRATVTLGSSSPSAHSSTRPLGHSTTSHRRIDLRVSTLPTTYGERLVIRLLDTAAAPHLLTFGALGMPASIESAFKAQAARASGIVLVTGPTGSGKTTTLYTTLAWIGSGASDSSHSTTRPLNHSTSSSSASSLVPSAQCLMPSSPLNLMTIEDPVEYDLSIAGLSISQTQLNPKKNMTFAAGLRHMLRQDPDVIMVGEVRDEETARVAVQASLTGHLVLSTLHTNDAASAVARLLDLNVEPFLVGSSLASVLAQRLVRKRHAECAGRGCEVCLHTGYKGRIGVFELLTLDAELRAMVADRVPAPQLKALAATKGLIDLRSAGTRLVEQGVTDLAEVDRAIEGIE